MFLIERLLLAIALSGLSGCDSSLLYLSIEEDESTSTFGKLSMYGVMGMVVASLSFSLFFKDSMKLAAFMTIIPYFIAFLLTFFLKDKTDEKKINISFKTLVSSLKENKRIVFVLFASVLLTDTTHTLTVFYNQLQYERVGINIQYYGMIFMLLQLLGMTSGLLGKITEFISKEKLASLLFGVAAMSSFTLIYTTSPLISVLLLMILTCVEVMFFPILSIIQNESIQTSARATTLSFYSLIMNVTTIFTSVSFGSVANFSLKAAYFLAFVFCVLGYLLFMIWKYQNKK